MLTSSHYTAILTAAATRHSEPVDPASLLDLSQGQLRHYLRARLNAIVTYHLHHNHKEPIERIAKAYKLEWTTVQSRIKTGSKLIRKSPWKETYLSLP